MRREPGQWNGKSRLVSGVRWAGCRLLLAILRAGWENVSKLETRSIIQK
jgi:hypothetical protein